MAKRDCVIFLARECFRIAKYVSLKFQMKAHITYNQPQALNCLNKIVPQEEEEGNLQTLRLMNCSVPS